MRPPSLLERREDMGLLKDLYVLTYTDGEKEHIINVSKGKLTDWSEVLNQLENKLQTNFVVVKIKKIA